MSLGTIHALFGNHINATAAIEAARNCGFAAGKFSVIGKDSDNFRTATAVLQSKRCDDTVFWAGIIGAGVGCLAGFLGLPHFPERDLYFLMFVPLGAAVSGTAVGMIMGMIIGAVLRLDDMPVYDATVRLGEVQDGDMVVSIAFESDAERNQLLDLLEQNGAKNISLDLDFTEPLTKPMREPLTKPMTELMTESITKPLTEPLMEPSTAPSMTPLTVTTTTTTTAVTSTKEEPYRLPVSA